MYRAISRCLRVRHRVASPAVLPSVPQRALLTSANRRQQQQEEDMDELKKNTFYSKYADKIKKMEETKPDELQSKLNVIEADRKKLADEQEKAREEEKKETEERASQAQAGKLKAFMKTELLEDKTADEITEIWLEYHKEKDCIYGVMPVNEYEQLMERAREFTTFVYPLPRQQGYEFFTQQFDHNMINFTPLIAYQAYGENAPVCLRMTHFTEVKDKGIILMRGEPDPKVLSIHEAQLLALQVKMYYGVNSGLKFNLVRLFNTSPDSFRHQDLVKEFENYKKDIQVARDATF